MLLQFHMGVTITSWSTPPVRLGIWKIVVVNVIFHSGHFQSSFIVDFLDFGMGLCTQDQCTVKFILIQRDIIGISSFPSDLFQRRKMVKRFPNDLLFTMIRSVTGGKYCGLSGSRCPFEISLSIS